MELHADVAAMLRAQSEQNETEAVPFELMGLTAARAMTHGWFGSLALPSPLAERVGAVSDAVVPGAPPVPVRLYRPVEEPTGVVVWAHTGGFTVGSLDATDTVCRSLVARAGTVVVSAGYRLAPEHPFPAALQDMTSVVEWTASGGDAREWEGLPLLVAGESAGGNLAAVAALQSSASGIPIAGQVLVYPSLDATMSSPSYVENAQAPMTTADTMRWFWDNYVPDRGMRDDPRVSPLLAPDVSGAPPAVVLTVEHDPLRDDGRRYAARLRDAGVAVREHRYGDLVHNVFSLVGALPVADRLHDDAAAGLRELAQGAMTPTTAGR